MLSFPSSKEEVFFKDWRMLGVDYLVIGRINISDFSEEIITKYTIFDVAREKSIHRGSVIGPVKTLRKIGHKVSDKIYSRIQGIPGIFSTKIAYIDKPSTDDPNFNLRISDIDGYDSLSIFSSPQPLMSPSWSPNGQDIAYVSFETSLPRIYTQNIATGQRRQITNYPNINSSPVWSPDGNRLAMVLSKDGSPDIYVQDLLSNELIRVTDHPAIDTEPSWSRDGSAIVFMSDRTGQPQIYQMEVGASSFNVERLTYDCFQCMKGQFLPDGVNMVHVRRETRQDPNYQIAILNVETLRVITLTDTSLDESPSVAPNGSMIMYATKFAGRGVLDAVSIDGRVKFRLPSAKGDVREPSWSPFFN